MNHKKIGTLVVFENGSLWREFPKQCKLTGLSLDAYGYRQVKLNGKMLKVHRIVIETFKGKSDLTVDHIDGNKLNNDISNLEYVTREENTKRAFNLGLFKERDKINSEKRKKKVLWNGKVYNSATELCEVLGVSNSAVTMSIKKDCNLKGHKAVFLK